MIDFVGNEEKCYLYDGSRLCAEVNPQNNMLNAYIAVGDHDENYNNYFGAQTGIDNLYNNYYDYYYDDDYNYDDNDDFVYNEEETFLHFLESIN